MCVYRLYMKRIFYGIGIVMVVVNACVAEEKKPNVVVIFLDDSGYGDFKPFGDPAYATPEVEKLAKQGMRLNQFYVPQGICSASRAALLSGCYPGRTKVFSAHGPGGRGLEPKFMTMAEMLKKHGYATGHFGKWHCGDQAETRPLARGFDEHAGLMYSNDMWRFHPVSPKHWGKKPLQYWENGKVKIEDVSKKDQESLTKWATDYSVDFIKRNKEKPFFLYLAHSMPHVPLFCSKEFQGKSGKGLYGDVIMEIDWSVGQVNNALKEAGVERDTLVIFSSDNGPWAAYGERAGVTPFREAKATSFDGGTRSATVFKYPAKVKAGSVLDKAICSIDLLPTVAHLTGAKLPTNEIDGKNIWKMLGGSGDAENPHAYYAFTTGRNLECIVSGDGKWKLHKPHGYRHVVVGGKGGMPGRQVGKKIEWALFDLENDPEEKVNLFEKEKEVAARLKKLIEGHQQKF